MHRLFALLSLILILASCQVLGGSEPSAGDTGTNGSAAGDDHPIQWDRAPLAVVFRAEVIGGDNADAFYMQNDVPLCTIYGDGRIVWTPVGFDGIQVLIDQLDDTTIRDFVSHLTIQERIYTYSTRADLEVSAVLPVYERLTLTVNGVQHQTDAFDAWPDDYFSRILERCQSLGQAPAIYEPQAGWVSTTTTGLDANAPTFIWDAEGTGVDLAELETDEPRWVEGRAIRIIWNALRDGAVDTQFVQDQLPYHVALQVPGITIDAPPPPQ